MAIRERVKRLGSRARSAAGKFDAKMGEVGERIEDFDDQMGELIDDDSDSDDGGFEPLDLEEFGMGGGSSGSGGSSGYQDIDLEDFGMGADDNVGDVGLGDGQDSENFGSIDLDDHGLGDDPHKDIDPADFGFGR